jgi:hypothetical protein
MQAAKNVQQSNSRSKSHGQNGNGGFPKGAFVKSPPQITPLPTPEVIDFEVQNHGSIFLLCPLTESAIEWVDEHLPEDAFTFGRGICVEHRFISDIVRGIQGDGLVVI